MKWYKEIGVVTADDGVEICMSFSQIFLTPEPNSFKKIDGKVYQSVRVDKKCLAGWTGPCNGIGKDGCPLFSEETIKKGK